MTRRRWIADSWNDSSAIVSGASAMHLARVLRAQPGTEFDIVAGGDVRRGTLAEISDSAARFTLGTVLDADPALPLTLLLSIFKFDRMEWAIEKATELGAQRIVPVIARRTEKHLAQAATARVERWRRIAREAAQQSRRSDTPLIGDPISIKDALKDNTPALRLLLAERETNRTLRTALEENNKDAHRQQDFHLAIGPEGGWTSEEEEVFAGSQWIPVSLGPRILRAETAAITATAVIAAFLEE